MKSEDGSRVAAEDVVFGTFLTRLGPITAIHREAGEIQIQEVTTKKPLTIRVIADSQLKTMPDMRAMMLAARPGERTPRRAAAACDSSTSRPTMERLPAAKIEDLKVGGAVIVTSTKGAKSDDGDRDHAAGQRRFPGADGAGATSEAKAAWTPSIACTAECWRARPASALPTMIQ